MADSDCSESESSCLWCGKEFRRRNPGGRRPVYCSDKCRHLANGKLTEWDNSERSCKQCGSAFIPRTQKNDLCSYECRLARAKEIRQSVAKETAACGQCGQEFVKNLRNKKFCSDACQRKHYRKIYEQPERGPFTCEHCAEEYFTGRPAGEGERFCSRECAYTALARETGPYSAVYFPICTACTKQFVAGRANKTRCSDECDKKHLGRRSFEYSKAKKALIERACKECGTLFIPEYGNKKSKFCSEVCSKKQQSRISKSLRRARIRGALCAAIDPAEVFKRDKWRCRICGKKTPAKKRGTIDHDAPELDHILPLAAGGSHTWENVQCACRACNGAKGAKPLGQLFLFGSMT